MNPRNAMPSFFNPWIIISLTVVALVSSASDPKKSGDIYSKCGKTATCFGLNSQNLREIRTCPKSSDCIASAVILPPTTEDEHDATYNFHLQLDYHSNNYGYVAIGISTRKKMDELLILECVKEAEFLYGYVSWNPSTNRIFTTFPTRIYGESTKSGSPSKRTEGLKIKLKSSDSFLYCDFAVPNPLHLPLPDNDAFEIDLDNTKYYVSVALGGTGCNDIDVPPGGLTGGPALCHHPGIGAGKDLFKLRDIQSKVKVDPHLLRKLHALLMVIAYFTLIPTATIMARFFRETFSRRQIFKKRVWFSIHVGLLYTTLVCTIVGYIFMIIGAGRAWPTDRDSSAWIHATVGMASMILLLSQTIIPWIIPSRQLLVKRTYSLIHAIVGSACYFLGLLNIALTPYLMPEFVNCSVILITFVWMGCHFCIYWLFVTLLVIKDHEMINNNSRFRALISYPMRLKTMDEAPGTKIRIIFFVIFLTLSLTTTTTMGLQIFQDSPQCPIYLSTSTNK